MNRESAKNWSELIIVAALNSVSWSLCRNTAGGRTNGRGARRIGADREAADSLSAAECPDCQ